MFWPKDIWGKHAKALEEFKEPRKREAAVRCLNELVRGGGCKMLWGWRPGKEARIGWDGRGEGVA